MSESEKGGRFCKKVVEVNVVQMGVEKVDCSCDFVSCCDVTNIVRSIYWFVLQWS